MKKVLLSLCLLVVSSLACMETAAGELPAPTPAPAAAMPAEPSAPAVSAVLLDEADFLGECVRVKAAEWLNVRNDDRKVIGYLPAGVRVTVIRQDSEWWLVQGERVRGWVYSKYLEPCP